MYMGTSCHENSWCVSQSLKYNSAIYLNVLSLFCRRVNVTGTNKQSSLLLFLSNECTAFLTDLVFIQIPLHSCHIHSKPLTSNHINKTVSLPFLKSGTAGESSVCCCPQPASQQHRVDSWASGQLPLQRAPWGSSTWHATPRLAQCLQHHYRNPAAPLQIPRCM